MDYSLSSYASIPEAFFAAAADFPDSPVYHQAVAREGDADTGPREWRTVTFKEAAARITKVAAWLRARGLKRGDHVAILSNTRPEWMGADLAVLACGGVSVSVYQSLTADEVGYILFDSETSVVFAENEEQLAKLNDLAGRDIPIAATEERPATTARLSFKCIVTFEETAPQANVTSLASILQGGDGAPFTGIEKLSRSDLAALVYTSGTTGPPKGVMQTHGNHLANVRQAMNAEIVRADSTIMLVLPLAHSFAKLMGYLGFLTPAELKFAAVTSRTSSKPDPFSVSRDIREGSGRIVPIVPRLLEKMKEGIERRMAGSGIEAKLLSVAVNSALDRYYSAAKGSAPKLSTSIFYPLTGGIRLKIRKKIFGPNLQYCVSGGAKLPRGVAEFFDALGIEVCEGYGLTETCVATNVNRAGHKKIGTVGPVLDKDIEVRIKEDGEICFRGPNVTSGYYKRAAATKAAWDSEGWFMTGDLGSIDSDGFLSITGRKKELIVTSGGKKIAPDPIEQEIKRCPLVSQALLFGDEQKYCVAIATLIPEAVAEWAARGGFSVPGDPARDQRVHAEVWKHIEKMNQQLASYQSIKRLLLISDDFTIENKLLTPTFKVRRRDVYAKYRPEILALYEKGK